MTSTSGMTFELRPAGAFSLAEAAGFGFGPRAASDFDEVLRLAFTLDGTWRPVGVEVRQAGGAVTGAVVGSGDAPAVARQVARILSLDHDGRDFDAVGAADPVIGRLQAAAPGLRPVLFHSPYEAAAWAVLSARRPTAQMRAVRHRLSLDAGTRFDLAGREVAAFPSPAALLAVDTVPGLDGRKVARLHGVARAALDGLLDIDHLRSLGPDGASAAVRELEGIGPFYASLIVIRACGWADLLPTAEPRLLDAVASLHGLDGPPSPPALAALASSWRPLRTWAAVLIRAARPRLSAGAG